MKNILNSTTFFKSPNQVSTTIELETVLLDINKGNYYSIDPVGSRIWKILDEPKSIQEICSILITEYNIDIKTCEQHVNNFLNKLHDEGLILEQ